MNGDEPIELTNALALLRADHDSGRQQLQADLEALDATPEETEVWLTALEDMHRAAASTFFRIENDTPPKLTIN